MNTEENSSHRIASDPERRAPIILEAGEDEEGKIEPSHHARYNFALIFVGAEDLVLDLPCGTGYGSALLGQKAKEVTGVDISEAAIGHAKEFFASTAVEFFVGDAEHLPEEVKSRGVFDAVVSFEGLEHVPHPEQMLAEIHSVLPTGGKLVMSTPRRPHGSPHHIIEFSLEEFTEILGKTGFVIEDMYGQIYTDIFKMSERPEVDPHSYRRFNYIAVCRTQ